MEDFFMKRLFLIVLLIATLLSFGITAPALALPLPQEPPIQVSGVEIVGGYTIMTWDANTEGDLGGYMVCYSVNGTGFVYSANTCNDLGDVTIFYFDDPIIATLWLGGNTVFFGLGAYDIAGSDDTQYDPGDNVSGLTTIDINGDPLSISFFADAPPANPAGVQMQ
jgi:hypothetical protein